MATDNLNPGGGEGVVKGPLRPLRPPRLHYDIFPNGQTTSGVPENDLRFGGGARPPVPDVRCPAVHHILPGSFYTQGGGAAVTVSRAKRAVSSVLNVSGAETARSAGPTGPLRSRRPNRTTARVQAQPDRCTHPPPGSGRPQDGKAWRPGDPRERPTVKMPPARGP